MNSTSVMCICVLILCFPTHKCIPYSCLKQQTINISQSVTSSVSVSVSLSLFIVFVLVLYNVTYNKNNNKTMYYVNMSKTSFVFCLSPPTPKLTALRLFPPSNPNPKKIQTTKVNAIRNFSIQFCYSIYLNKFSYSINKSSASNWLCSKRLLFFFYFSKFY